MSVASDAEKDRSAGLAAAVRPAAAWRVLSVEVLSDYCLGVRFVDGTEGLIDMRRLIGSPNAGIFNALEDPALFEKAHVALGAVTWPGDLDLAPDAMYEAIKLRGFWEPR